VAVRGAPWHQERVDGDALIGRTLGGAYRLDRRLGAGGMGAVYAATHARTGRGYAVKVLLPEVAARRDALARFRREADAVSALGHANIVGIHDFHEDGGLAYLVMDLLSGEDLGSRLERAGTLPLDEALAVFEDVAAGLEVAHERGLVHRDLKPANVFLASQPGSRERAVLLDFGLARSVADEGELGKLTASGVVLGTPQYMSPEQAAGAPLDARADLYSLATILYEMLAGRPPFSAPNLPALFARLITDPAPPLSRARPDLPIALSDVLDRALAKDPGVRFADARALVAAVRTARGSIPGTGEHAALPPTIARPMPSSAPVVLAAASGESPRRSSRLWIAVAAATVVAGSVAGAAGAALLFFGAEQHPENAVASVPALDEPVHEVLLEPAIDEAVIVPDAPAPVAEPREAAPRNAREEATPDEAPPQRRRVARTLEPARAPELEPPSAPAAPPQPQAPAGPPPAGPAPGIVETVEFQRVQDWQGCIRSTHRFPRSEPLLGQRLSCAAAADDDAELRATCAELRQHYPRSGYLGACRSYGP
jgi:serine/threonine protein kinase